MSRIAYTGSGEWQFNSGANKDHTYTFVNNFNLGTTALNSLGGQSSGTVIMDFGSSSVTCGAFSFGNSVAGTAVVKHIFSTSMVSCASVNANTYNAGTAIDSLNGSVWMVSGFFSIPAAHTWYSGTSTIRATGTGTWTLAGKSLYTLRCAMPAASTMTFADSLTATTFAVDSGLVNTASKAFYLKNLIAGTDTLFFGGNVWFRDTASIGVKSGAALKFAAIDTGSINGKLGGINSFAAITPDSAARLHLPEVKTWSYASLTDITVSPVNQVASNGTNIDGGGNTGFLWPVTGGGSATSNRLNSRQNINGLVISP